MFVIVNFHQLLICSDKKKNKESEIFYKQTKKRSLSKKYKLPLGKSKNISADVYTKKNLGRLVNEDVVNLNNNNYFSLNTNFNLISTIGSQSKNNYSCHTCDENSRNYSCDNSYNYLSQCSSSLFTNCSFLKPVIDCKNVSSYFEFSRRFIGDELLKYSSFGASSKCINIQKGQFKSGICSKVLCHYSKRSYYIMFNQNQSNQTIICFH